MMISHCSENLKEDGLRLAKSVFVTHRVISYSQCVTDSDKDQKDSAFTHSNLLSPTRNMGAVCCQLHSVMLPTGTFEMI
jgi:hypothetical protein